MEKQIVNEYFGFDQTPKITFQKNLVLVTVFV